MSPVELFLQAVENRNRDLAEPQVLSEALAEMREHLHESAYELAAMGMGNEEAELIAVRRFGKASTISLAKHPKRPIYRNAPFWLVAVMPLLTQAVDAALSDYDFRFYAFIWWPVVVGTLAYAAALPVSAFRTGWRALTGASAGLCAMLLVGAGSSCLLWKTCPDGSPLVGVTHSTRMDQLQSRLRDTAMYRFEMLARVHGPAFSHKDAQGGMLYFKLGQFVPVANVETFGPVSMPGDPYGGLVNWSMTSDSASAARSYQRLRSVVAQLDEESKDISNRAIPHELFVQGAPWSMFRSFLPVWQVATGQVLPWVALAAMFGPLGDIWRRRRRRRPSARA